MSWKALDWATESDIRSPTTKFVLHLLANKADEEFSCYPSIRTLMAESGAGRSTVMRALQELQAEGFPLEPPIRTTNRTSIRRHQGAGRSAGSLAGWQEGCRNPDTRHRGRAGVGLDPPDPHPTHRTQTRRRPKPRTGPGSTPRRPTPSAPTLLPANHRVVRRLRRRTITHRHHRHARRHRSSRVLPPLQPASPTKSTGPSPCAKEVNSIGKQHL